MTGSPPSIPEPVTPLFRFLLHPQLHEHAPGSLTASRWAGWLCLLLLVAGIVGTVMHGPVAHAFGWKMPPDALLTYLSTHPSMAAAMSLLFAPILEELGFRAFLSTDPKAIFVGLAFFITYAYGFAHINFVHVTDQYLIAHYYSGMFVLVPAGVVSLLTYLCARQQILTFFRRHGAWVFWISCVLFGAGHAADYANAEPAWSALVFALPQFLVGIGLAYVRITFGLRWSMLTHWVFDWLLVSISWSVLLLASDPAARAALGLAIGVAALFVLVYGAVACTRVAQGRW